MFTLALGYIIAAPFLAIGRALAAAFKEFGPEPFRFSMGAPDLVRAIDGQAVGSATQQSLRHEAGVPRLSAARNV